MAESQSLLPCTDSYKKGTCSPPFLGREKIPCYHLNSQKTHVLCLCKYCVQYSDPYNGGPSVTAYSPARYSAWVRCEAPRGIHRKFHRGLSPAGSSLSAFLTATYSFHCFCYNAQYTNILIFCQEKS